MSTRSYILNKIFWKEIQLDKILYVVEGFEYKDDEESSFNDIFSISNEKGDYFLDSFNNMQDAIQKINELIKRSWEIIRLTITASNDNVKFILYTDLTTKKNYVKIMINTNNINKKLSNKLIKIKKIVEGD